MLCLLNACSVGEDEVDELSKEADLPIEEVLKRLQAQSGGDAEVQS